ncbi:MAG: DUF6364 family protein [Rhizonema sp. NSF051]|nr:DUF6364 family protein [Rhizonema sp. NSF051]
MQTEIILCLDNELIQKADRWAKAHSVSLNDAITTFLEQLPDPDQPLVLSPWTKSLVSNLTTSVEQRENTLQEQYIDYLEDKYQ